MNPTLITYFDYFPGNHHLTEEIIYQQQAINVLEAIPVYSGSMDNESPMSYICKNAINKNGEAISYFKGPCILLTKDGSAGLLTLKTDTTEFTLNHHACVLKLKSDKEGLLDLEWFVRQFQSVFFQVCTSKSDNRVFSTEWFDRLELQIPDFPIQVKQNKKKQVLVQIIELIKNIQKKTDELINLQLDLSDLSLKTDLLSNLFYCNGGNSGLTEEFIYNNQPENEEDKVEIITSATQESNLMGFVSKKSLLPGNKPLKIFSDDSLIVTRNGYAGTMYYVSNKSFTTNDHAYVLTVKPKYINKINIEWFSHQYQNIFKNVITSKSDNATFNTEWLKKISIVFPEKEIQNQKIKTIRQLMDLVAILANYKRQAEKLVFTPIKK